MIPEAFSIAQVAISAAAIAGLIVLTLNLRAQGEDDPLTKRFVFGVRVTMMLFIGRALAEIFGGAWTRAIVILAAAMIPLAVLLLTEGLLRRHAPSFIKTATAAGAVVFALSAFVASSWIDPARIWLLFGFQVVVLTACGWLVMNRDRDDLSGPENETVGRLGLSLLLFIPLICADYGMELIGLPVQISAIGVLALCWLAIGLGRNQANHRSIVIGFMVMTALSIVAAWVIATLTQADVKTFVVIAALILSTILVVVVLNDARAQRAEARSLSLLRHIAHGPNDDALAFLRGLQSHPAVEGALLINDDNLSDLDAKTLAKIFDVKPVIRRNDPPMDDPACREHIRHLFERYEASHIMEVSTEPRRLVALAMPTLASSITAELELAAVQRMAMLMGRKT